MVPTWLPPMSATLDKPAPLHRERTPARACRRCGAWLSSANEDPYCFQCGGWTTQRLSPVEALAERPQMGYKQRERVAAALSELIG